MCEHCGCGHPHGPEGGGAGHETIAIEQDVLAHDRAHAQALRARMSELGARLVNVIGGPGCGKTELLAALIRKLEGRRRCLVVEGDLATDNDAARIRAVGAPVHQIHTGTVCHLTAHDVEHALEHLPMEPGALVLVENVGNLVCPAMFDLGESLRIVCLSVTEGTDKPQKYPVAFREASVAVITKSDLLPHVDFDLHACRAMVADIRPGTRFVVTSARDGSGLTELADVISSLWS
ncbi:MAG: hydrogenase nickel incorporation protein HypB [Deltaproteobacteria bacterium]|nr:hydrogenase nickel incorporation protein HypB [Deltaproteobacteria bacterium]